MTLDPTDTRPVLITGGCGFIGCNLADRLACDGSNVLVLDSFVRGGVRENAQWLKSRHGERIRISVCDIRDPIRVIEAVREARAVLHLAAQVAVTSSVETPLDDFEINARGTINVLEALRLHNPEAPLVFASTNKVYGGMEQIEIVEKDGRYAYRDLPQGMPETTPLDFHSPYGCSKGAGDQYVRDYARIYGLKTVVFRQSCIYGTRQFGIEDQGWVAWFTIATVLGKPITLYGDGKQVRDVLYVDDLVRLYETAIAPENIDRVAGKVFNAGGGADNAMSLLELLSHLERLSGRPVPVSSADWRPGDQKVFVADVSRVEQVLGWRPRISPAEGVAKLWDWTHGNRDILQKVLG